MSFNQFGGSGFPQGFSQGLGGAAGFPAGAGGFSASQFPQASPASFGQSSLGSPGFGQGFSQFPSSFSQGAPASFAQHSLGSPAAAFGQHSFGAPASFSQQGFGSPSLGGASLGSQFPQGQFGAGGFSRQF